MEKRARGQSDEELFFTLFCIHALLQSCLLDNHPIPLNTLLMVNAIVLHGHNASRDIQ